MKHFTCLSLTFTINYTNCIGLAFCSVLLSIEIKKHDRNSDRAELQIII